MCRLGQVDLDHDCLHDIMIFSPTFHSFMMKLMDTFSVEATLKTDFASFQKRVLLFNPLYTE